MSATDSLVAFITSTEHDDVPDEAVEAAKRAIIDVVGVGVYGSQHDIGDKIGSYVARTFGGDEATVFGSDTASPAGAALANGTVAHAIDYDDTFESIVIHPSAPVFSAALAVAESEGATGRDLLTGYLVGVETAFRIGHSTYPAHYVNGWHATGTIGTFGAAAGAGSVLDLPAEETRHALAVAASSSSALKKNFGSMTKPLHAGHAAHMGVQAAFLAASGFTGDREILDGEMGYGAVMTSGGEYDPSAVTDDFGEEWAIQDVGFKPYPSGVISHAAMDAMAALVDTHDLEPADVESITVTLDEAAEEMLIHSHPEDELQAKFSIEFCLAAVLREGTPGVAEFTDGYVTAPETKEAIQKVNREFEPNLFGGEFAGYGARVVVKLADGRTLEAEERRAPGSPSNPISEERLAEKFRDCVGPVLSDDDAETLREMIHRLDEEGTLDDFLDIVA